MLVGSGEVTALFPWDFRSFTQNSMTGSYLYIPDPENDKDTKIKGANHVATRANVSRWANQSSHRNSKAFSLA